MVDMGASDSLLIESAATTGRGAIFAEGLCKFLVQAVCHVPRDALPCQNEDHHHSTIAMVPRPPPHKTQQLLLHATTTYNLAHTHTRKYVSLVFAYTHRHRGHTFKQADRHNRHNQPFTGKQDKYNNCLPIWQLDNPGSSFPLCQYIQQPPLSLPSPFHRT